MRSPRSLKLVAAALALALIATACGGPTASETESAASGTDAVADSSVDDGATADAPAADDATDDAAPAADAGEALLVPQLTDEFATTDGTTIDLATLQGEDVVLWFWAPW